MSTTSGRHSAVISAQACIRHLHLLEDLQVAYINTPEELGPLDDMLGCLPALEAIGLHFCSKDSHAAIGRVPPQLAEVHAAIKSRFMQKEKAAAAHTVPI
jgi:hypothetical protein